MSLQTKWRIAGVISLAAAGLMAWHGSSSRILRAWDWPGLLVYWSVFFVLLVCAIVIALLDVRYIRLRYALERRSLFLKTVGSESLRKTLREARDPGGEERNN